MTEQKERKRKRKGKTRKIKQTNRQEDMERRTQNYLNRNKTVIECKSTQVSDQKHNKMF